jgi:outer membrane protein TolC
MKKIIIYIALFLPLIGFAQPTITLKSAIDTTLKNSFDIQIASNNFEITKTNNTFGVAGGLPTLNLNVSENQSYISVNQELYTGDKINRPQATANALNSSANIGMTLFNGFRIWATKKRLSILEQQSELQLNNQIQNSIASVMAKYYDIIRQQEYLKIMQNSLDVSQKKLDIITEKKNVGMANDADFLQAQIDVNSATQSLRTQQAIVEQVKTDLLQLMSQKTYYPYSVTDSISVDNSIELNDVTGYLNRNPQYMATEEQIRINEQALKEVSALRFPTLRLTGGYSMNRTKNSAGNILLNESYGPNVGLTLAIPVFNGGSYKAQKDVAEFNVENAALQKESLFNTLTSGAIKTHQSYSSAIQQLEAQKNTLELSGKLINVILQRFQVNQATILDVKAAQASYETTGYQYINLSYAAKIAEIELKRLMYKLGN